MLRTIALAAVLLAGSVAAQETTSGSRSSQQQSSEKAKGGEKADEEKAQGAKGADANAAETKSDKGYGYGTPSGTEASSDAKQAADGNEKRPQSKTPQQEEGASVTQPHARAEAGTLTGRILSADEGRLTIEAPDGMRDIQLTSRTEVRGEGRTSTSQLRRGDEVRVSFDPKEGTSVAKRIEVRSTGSTGGEAGLTPPPGSATPPGSTVTPSGTPGGTTPGTATPGGTTAPSSDTRR
jgi:hypothetical protein